MKWLSILVFGLLLVNVASAAPVSVGSYVFDDQAFVSSMTGTTGSVFSSNSSASAITDLNAATYVYSSNSGSIGLAFGNASIYNGVGADLALFFLGNTSTVTVSLSGNSTVRSYSSSYMYMPNGNQYGVQVGNQVYGLSVALVNLDDFGFSANTALGDFRVGLGVNNYMSLVGGFHTQPASVVPLPAPVVLLFSGLAALGLIGRRK
jgi:hypothetical protein